MNPEDYSRMFAGKSFFYLLTEIFLGHYNKLGVLSVQDQDTWMSFLPKKVQEKTLKEGRALYSSGRLYEKYERGFRDYMKESAKYFESVLAQDEMDHQEVREFIDQVSRHFSYYAKTEFFYTDGLDRERMVMSVQEFDRLKLEGRTHLNKLVLEDDCVVRILLKKVAEQESVSDADLLSYSIDELVGLVRDGEVVDPRILGARLVYFASRDLTLFGDEACLLVNKFLSAYRGKSNIIKGTVANRGKARGKARVFIPEFDNFNKIADEVEAMNKGEILIAETTAPEIIQACKKAAAIVTNQGGMLSHAAIVSRELGIPCVIGTDKDVVLNIQTGDEIEVDANKGVVKKL